MIDWMIDLTEEQKKNTKHILLYADEFDADTWESYCEIAGECSCATVLRFQICGSSAEYEEDEGEDDDEEPSIPWELLDLFHERDRALEMMEREEHGSYGIVVFREDFNEITHEMEEYFEGEDEFEIYLEW